MTLTDDAMRRLASEQFALLFQVFEAASTDVQQVIREMAEIASDNRASYDEREAAIDTLTEALFPTRHHG